jgi:hypothetical protein
MTAEEAAEFLKLVACRPPIPSLEAIAEALATLKKQAAARGDQKEAKKLWCLEQVLQTQNLYLRAFSRLKACEFYLAWCDFEQAEIGLAFLERHDTGFWQEFRLDFIRKQTAKWQSLYPYKIFISPEMIERSECSICGRRTLPRKPCGHIIGEIYDGEMCCRVVTAIEAVLGMAFVSKPVQKYSVLFWAVDPDTGENRDHYNYGVVKFAADALGAPFDDWELERTTRRQPHSRFTEVRMDGPCPCESGKPYNDCCLPEEGVLRPHVEFTFAVPPPPGTPQDSFIA